MWKSKKSITRKWAGACFLILLVPVFVSSMILCGVEKSAKQEVNEMNIALLNPLEREIDRELANVYNIYTEVSTMLHSNGALKNEKLSLGKMREISRQISDSTFSSQALVENICIFFHTWDIAISVANGISDAETIYEVVFGQWSGDWLENITPKKKSGEFRFVEINSDGLKQKPLVFTGFAPIGSNASTNVATVVILLNERFLLDRAKSISELDGRQIYLADENNEILLSSDPSLSACFKMQEQETLYYQDDMIYSYVQLDNINWRCVLVTPQKIYSGKLTFVRILVVINLVVSLLFGGFCVLWFLKRNYSPIHNIISLIRRVYNVPQEGEMDEYTFMTQFMNDLISTNRAERERLEKQGSLLLPSFFSRVVRMHNKFSTRELADSFALSFPSDCFAVVILEIVGVENLFPGEKLMFESEREEIAQFIMYNIMTELFNRHHSCNIFEYEGFHVALICILSDSDGFEEKLRHDFEGGVQVMETHFNISANAVCGNIHSEIAECYKEAFEALEYMHLAHMNGFVSYNDISQYMGDANKNYYFPIEQEIQLVNCIKSGNKAETEKKLDEIFHRNFTEDKSNIENLRNLMFDIAYTLLKIVTRNGDRLQFFEVLPDTDNLLKMKESIYAAAFVLCDKIAEQTPNSVDVAAQVKEFVEERYRDVNLNLQTIGEALKLTPYYVSKLFKADKGYSVLEYLRKLRASEAKKIIHGNPDYRLEQIAEMVGLADARTLAKDS